MQTEVEIKARIASLLKIKKELIRIGARKKGSKRIVDIYYTPARGEKFYGKNSRLKFRIRHDGRSNKGSLEVHKPLNHFETVEYELPVTDIKLIQQMLKELRFVKCVVVDKVRELYTYGKLNIVLDKVRGLGEFMEVEMMNTDSKKALIAIKEFYKKIGVLENDFIIGIFYDEMMMKSNSKKK
ncbi:MAG: class IV adenylate cyclase [Patescibacteria group bacterium]|jgi:predicted adenylyl cyclase CyaB